MTARRSAGVTTMASISGVGMAQNRELISDAVSRVLIPQRTIQRIRSRSTGCRSQMVGVIGGQRSLAVAGTGRAYDTPNGLHVREAACGVGWSVYPANAVGRLLQFKLRILGAFDPKLCGAHECGMSNM